MKHLLITLGILTGSFLAAATAQAKPYNTFLPAIVTTKAGTAFWCNAYQQMHQGCRATEVNSEGFAVIINSPPIPSCEGGLWGFIILKGKYSTGYTLTPDDKHKVTMDDLCRPGLVVTFRPNAQKPQYDDLVGLYQGKEVFRYKGVK